MAAGSTTSQIGFQFIKSSTPFYRVHLAFERIADIMSTTMLQDPSASKIEGSHDVLATFNCLDMSQGVKAMKVTEDLYEE